MRFIQLMPLLPLLLFLPLLCSADEPRPSITLPLQAMKESEPVNPQPIATIDAGEWYIIASDLPLICLTSPDGIVKVEHEQGPIRLRGKFAGGGGRIESRNYGDPHLYFVESLKPGKTELILIPEGVTDAAAIVRQVLTVSGEGPKPPPVDPPKPVDPDVDPTPVTGLLKIVIIEETADRSTLPASQLSILTGAELREYAKTHCSKTGDTPDLRILDKDAVLPIDAPAWQQQAFAEPRAAQPWIVITNGTAGFSGPLPATMAETITLLSKYGGK